ncbi:uncharacterized protein LOC132508518 isoform X1 [Lagenorhynchus albirostris]|uniref:uncharacterized protein LOC132508518 isoform X1 n=1 Tax=Lagenorhynchus albirostris TaxID=27610 RepID=UPI0028EBC4F9|nr:uncharacterized protein LOC132508518 isoform X1 [Lagenorhynchus albirostris]XP_059984656.1 uncharacterized protein LOC132508518 isoform X1 [Lagenorhynchus albirostris]
MQRIEEAVTLAATWMPPEISTLQERSQTKKDTQGVTPLRRNIQNSAWGLMMETDTEGVTMCGVTSGKKSHGEGLPEDHVHLGPPCPLPAALHLGAELMHHVPEVMEVKGQPQHLLGDAWQPMRDQLHGEGLIKQFISSTESACVRNPSRRDFWACSLTSSLRITQFSWNPEMEGAGDHGPCPPRGPRARSLQVLLEPEMA